MCHGVPRDGRVLVVEHERDAGPEMFGRWLAQAGVEVDICRPYAGDKLPGGADHRALMVLGGSMGACDDREVPWLAQVRTMLAQATSSGRAVLGICLGAQMLAAACGGRWHGARREASSASAGSTSTRRAATIGSSPP